MRGFRLFASLFAALVLACYANTDPALGSSSSVVASTLTLESGPGWTAVKLTTSAHPRVTGSGRPPNGSLPIRLTSPSPPRRFAILDSTSGLRQHTAAVPDRVAGSIGRLSNLTATPTVTREATLSTSSRVRSTPGRAFQNRTGRTAQSRYAPQSASTRLPVPTASDLPEELLFNVSESWHSQLLNFATSPGYDPTKHLSIICEECVLEAQIGVKQGGWSLADASQLGFMDVSLNFSNRVLIRIQGNESGSMAFPFIPGDGDIPVPGGGIKIPGFGKAGLMLHPEFFVEWNLTDPLTLELGHVTESVGHHIVHIDFNNISASSYDGSTRGTHGAGKFDAPSGEVAAVNGTVSYGLRVHLKVVLDSVLAGASAEAGIHIDMPSIGISTSVHPIDQIKRACNGLIGYEEPSDRVMQIFAERNPSFIKVADETVLAFAAEFDAGFPWMHDDEQFHRVWKKERPRKPVGLCYVWESAGDNLERTDTVMKSIRDNLPNDTDSSQNGDDMSGKGGHAKKGGATATAPDTALSLFMGGTVTVGVAFLTFF